jgi:hypothetical protein
MQKRILYSYSQGEFSMTFNLFEILTWAFFYGFLEFIFPFFLDPFDIEFLSSIFDIPWSSWFEFIFFVIIPLCVIALSSYTSSYGSFYGLLLYYFITANPIEVLSVVAFEDLATLVCFIMVLYDATDHPLDYEDVDFDQY